MISRAFLWSKFLELVEIRLSPALSMIRRPVTVCVAKGVNAIVARPTIVRSPVALIVLDKLSIVGLAIHCAIWSVSIRTTTMLSLGCSLAAERADVRSHAEAWEGGLRCHLSAASS
jgi:hypothetical protein